jgi:hypothetical protein
MVIFEYRILSYCQVEAQVVDDRGNILAGPERGSSNGRVACLRLRKHVFDSP